MSMNARAWSVHSGQGKCGFRPQAPDSQANVRGVFLVPVEPRKKATSAKGFTERVTTLPAGTPRAGLRWSRGSGLTMGAPAADDTRLVITGTT